MGDGGSVTGLDISQALIAEATRKAAAAQLKASLRFVQADAAHSGLPVGAADCVVSRFGIMFFTDPYAAFAHLHSLLKPVTGRLAIACWAPMKENPWMLEVRTTLAAHFDLPKPPPRTPGPFAFEEPEYLRDILSKAGFQQIEIAPWHSEMYVGGPGSDPDSAADFLMQALSMAQRATDAPEAVRNTVRRELSNRLKNFMTPGGVKMPAAVWLATARA